MTNMVSAQWLHEHLTDKNVVILDASMAPVGFEQQVSDEVIPGALRFDIEQFSDAANPLPHALPSAMQYSAMMRKLGVSVNSHVVVYDNIGLYSAPRAWWMGTIFGLKHISVLDGGLPNWLKQGFATAQQHSSAAEEGNFKAVLNQSALVSAEDILADLSNGTLNKVDARGAARFCGQVAEPRKGLHSGHIPGAKNIPFTQCSHNGLLHAPNELRALFEQQGISPDNTLVASCGSGVTACVVLLAAAECGFQNLKLYDASWAEWGNGQWPIEVNGDV
ncbi:3-mercaptopyruvate sulfurtransferase [Neptunicella marina]|uniref:3-mercaptopyruvate sulfurtransferase n=1 Tax=Neptunicella marina TaxID=2125989 RepID=A0A8J6IXC7_9ALTE|nr:3-mercaptopyruvate sulfurtransferase [Neptunicella marina]MBC3767058.1 3-mercaptopyruvate sulfurtransferase [Neptunicella marina]